MLEPEQQMWKKHARQDIDRLCQEDNIGEYTQAFMYLKCRVIAEYNRSGFAGGLRPDDTSI